MIQMTGTITTVSAMLDRYATHGGASKDEIIEVLEQLVTLPSIRHFRVLRASYRDDRSYVFWTMLNRMAWQLGLLTKQEYDAARDGGKRELGV